MVKNTNGTREHFVPHGAIFAEQVSKPEVATALREHREDRDALLASLVVTLRADPRIRAAWLWGSFGRGEADDLSDLDLWLVVADDAVDDIGASLRDYAQRMGSFITGGEAPQNAPAGGGYFSSLHEGRHGLLHLDCYWQPQSAAEDVPTQAVLFDRFQEPYTASVQQSTAPQPPEALTDEHERIVDGIGFGWLMLSIAAKKLARDPASDMSLMMYPRLGLEDAAVLLGFKGFIAPSEWLVPVKPSEKVRCLRSLAHKTEQLSEAANGQGLNLSPQSAACLSRYLNIVEGILT